VVICSLIFVLIITFCPTVTYYLLTNVNVSLCSENWPHFRKLFPEYVAKYNQQQQLENTAAEPEPRENPAAPAPPAVQQAPVVANRAQPVAEARREKDQKKAVPFWMVLVMFSVFGAVMALPLMQL